LPPYVNGSTLRTAALCMGGLAVLLHPVSLVTLGVGVWLGYRGREWLRTNFSIREAGE